MGLRISAHGTSQPSQRLKKTLDGWAVGVIFPDVAVADESALVDDEHGRTGNPLLGMENPVFFDDPALDVGDEQIPDTELPCCAVDGNAVVRADGHDPGFVARDFFRILLQLDELSLAVTSEMSPVEQEQEVFLSLKRI